MKIKVQLKDPDALFDAVQDAVHDHVVLMAEANNLDYGERKSLEEARVEKVLELAKRWFRWSEYLTVEIDTDAETCVVLPATK